MTRAVRVSISGLAVVIGLGACPSLATAWNATGHRVVARIAWEHMTPRARARAVALLLGGPGVANLASLRPAAGAAAERDALFFMSAATWADLVKNRHEAWNVYSHPTWHYADFYWDVVNGQPHDIPGTGPDAENAGERITVFREELGSASVPDTAKAVDLAWLLHLVGDVHQPLHCSSRVTSRHPLPQGDRGGNAFHLDDTRNLHAYWDDILDETVSLPTYEDSLAYATRIAHQLEVAFPPDSAANASDVDIWERESLHLAQTVVYADLARGRVPSAAYLAQALNRAERQMALAGYRLANLLDDVLK